MPAMEMGMRRLGGVYTITQLGRGPLAIVLSSLPLTGNLPWELKKCNFSFSFLLSQGLMRLTL